MAGPTVQRAIARQVWALVARQHGVIARWQLLDLGMTARAIEHRIASGRLHRLMRGVYAIGRPNLTQQGWWMASVLACGPGAVLSHASAAAAWGIRSKHGGSIEISVVGSRPRPRGIRVHRRARLDSSDITKLDHIPLTSPTLTLIDLASRLTQRELEAAINDADKRDLISPESLRRRLERMPRRPGIAALRRTLDHRTFVLTDSELERRFLPLARAAGLPPPLTGQRLNGFKVDFHWPQLGLVIETDGLRYHRTPSQQARDRLRDQAHAAAGLTPLRFTHAQVRYEPRHVERTLAAVATRLANRAA